jgi:hypothetical protein
MFRTFCCGLPLREPTPRLQGQTSFRLVWFIPVIIAAAVYDLLLLSNGDLRLFAPELFDGVFNSMLLNLLHGDFTVAREAIGAEAFTRDGQTYAYFGVFPAVLRLLAMPFTDIAEAHLARLSCLTALVLFLAFQLRTLVVVHDSLAPASRSPLFLGVMIAATVLSGPQLFLLGSAWIYHEPIFWGAALGAAFNLVVVRAALGETGLGVAAVAMLAVLAGLAINTRPTVGVALYLGATLLAIGAALSFRLPGARPLLAAVPRIAADPHVWLPFLILAAFALAVGVVNYNRWGNALVFADYLHYDYALRSPRRMELFLNYGAINFTRVGTSALYYVTGIPYLLKKISPFAEFLNARFDVLEAPPSSGLLTNPLTIILAALGLYRLVRHPDIRTEGVAILRLALIGHFSAVMLVLAAWFLALRYRFDFAPFMTLAAFVGYRSFSLAAANVPIDRLRETRVVAVGLCVLGIVASHNLLIAHKIWNVGVPLEFRTALLLHAPFIFYWLNR